MKHQFVIVLILFGLGCQAQELFVFTEPASNMATKSLGMRLNNDFWENPGTASVNYLLIPEIMYGVSKNLMVHGSVFFSGADNHFNMEGGGIYLKYRVYNNDDVQTHFRIALFEKASLNNSEVHQQEINLNGFNSGFETGIIGTQLLHKMAFSSGLSLVNALNNADNKLPLSPKNNTAINYTLSVGKLVLPRFYKNYSQTNVNLMFELLSQFNPGLDKYYIDAAPSIQFIFKSQGRMDIGYRKQLLATLSRVSQSEIFIRLEYNLFNMKAH
jgi:hypothetical protein